VKHKKQKPSVCVTRRDIEMMVALYRYRCLSIGQVRRLLFPSEQTANRRTRRLAAAGYLRVLRVPGVDERLVFLARRGAELVAHELQVPREAITYPTLGREARHPFFVRHHLDVTDFRISLERECLDSGLKLLGFLPEFLSRKVEGGRIEKHLRDVVATGTSGEIAHVPDGVFAIERCQRPALFFVEIDRATEPVGNPGKGVLKAMRFYLDYLRGEGYQRYRDDFGVRRAFSGFRLLFVTTSLVRLENIRRASEKIENTDDGARRFLWLAPRDELRTSGILRMRWSSLDPADPTPYAITGDTGSVDDAADA
jgi:hypothetical protein